MMENFDTYENTRLLSEQEFNYLRQHYSEYQTLLVEKINEVKQHTSNPFSFSIRGTTILAAAFAACVGAERASREYYPLISTLAMWMGIIIFIYTLILKPMLWILYRNPASKRKLKALEQEVTFIESEKRILQQCKQYQEYLERKKLQ
ncbi:MAG: hypothetical protein MUF42_11125 [Cytophagaceae bacterium]|nr:hypothetical protein [Cytophagaceae bacterium]